LLTSTTVSADVTIDTGTNVARTSLGLTAMETNGTLQQIASQRAVEVASQWPKWDPSLHAQWIYGAMGCIKWGGENLAYNYNGTGFVDAWLASPDHRTNMLNPVFDQQGSAIYYDSTNGIFFAVQIFKDSCDPTGTTAPSADRTGNAPNAGTSSGPTGTELQTPVPFLPDTSTINGTANQEP